MMNRRCIAAGLLSLSALLAGCPESVHPVSDPATAEYDPELFGVWHGTFEDDTEIYLHIGPGEHGLTRAVLIEHKENGGGLRIENYVAFPTRLPKLIPTRLPTLNPTCLPKPSLNKTDPPHPTSWLRTRTSSPHRPRRRPNRPS